MLRTPLPISLSSIPAASPERRFLVLARVGDRSLHPHWIADAGCVRNWDLQLSAYGEDESKIQDGDLPPVIDRGTKWDSIVRHFRTRPELLDRYDYVMLPDDDLLMRASDINRFFEIVAAEDLWVAQPSLAPESYFYWPQLVHCPAFRFRFINFVEAMGCCMKASYLRQLLPLFERYPTGFGTDLVWAMLMDDPARKAAVVDAVQMVHTRPLGSSALYARFAAMGRDLSQEIQQVMNAYENTPHFVLVYGGRLRGGREAGGAATKLLTALNLFWLAPRAREPHRLIRAALGMLARILTQRAYVPARLRPRAVAVARVVDDAAGPAAPTA